MRVLLVALLALGVACTSTSGDDYLTIFGEPRSVAAIERNWRTDIKEKGYFSTCVLGLEMYNTLIKDEPTRDEVRLQKLIQGLCDEQRRH